jgi:hypothetical protein
MSLTFNEEINIADKIVHKIEIDWHYPIMTKYGYEPTTREAVGFVRHYQYVHPVTGHKIKCCVGINGDYWEGAGGFGYWRDLEPHLKKLHENILQPSPS